jgi:hypothetical protein
MYFEIEVDMVLSVDGDKVKEEIEDAIMDALIEGAEQFDGQLAGSAGLIPTTEEELEKEVEGSPQ